MQKFFDEAHDVYNIHVSFDEILNDAKILDFCTDKENELFRICLVKLKNTMLEGRYFDTSAHVVPLGNGKEIAIVQYSLNGKRINVVCPYCTKISISSDRVVILVSGSTKIDMRDIKVLLDLPTFKKLLKVEEVSTLEQEFVTLYKGTGRTLGEVVKALKVKGYTKNEVFETMFKLLKDEKWVI